MKLQNHILTENPHRYSSAICTLFIVFTAIVFSGCSKNNPSAEFVSIEQGFVTPPDSVQTSVYWYWISDNISKEGVINDLESMKEVGINRAFIGNIGLEPNGVPYGNVKIFSDEWWDILHTALKTATDLGIEIGIFNSPGWSQSGGPWVKPEQSMRYLASSEVSVQGPQKLSLPLSKPNDFFQDVKVLAYPVPEGKEETINARNASISSIPSFPGISKIADGDRNTEITLPASGNLTVSFKGKGPQTIRSIAVFPAFRPARAHAKLWAKQGNDFQLLKEFDVDRSNPNIIVGFNPFGPVVMALPETTAEEFRVEFSGARGNSGITEIVLTSALLQERYVEKTLAKMFQSPLPYWHEYQWPEQPESDGAGTAITRESILDISEFMDENGTLNWEVPEGNWKIIRSGMTTTGVVNEPASPEGTGLEIDKMSRKHVASHFDAFLGEIIRRIPPEDRQTWKVVVEDSYERGGQNWTDDFIRHFKENYGYDPVPFIPVFEGNVVESRDVSDRFLWDLRRLVADKIAHDYVGGLREVSNKNGLTTWLENYGHWGFPGEFLQYGGQSDEIGGEFWSEGDLGNIENRAASSSAHIYGKQKVSAESFTCSGRPFSRYPDRMKQRGDRFFTEGINNTLLHVYIQQPYEDKFPGMNAWFGNEFNRKNTWFYHMDMFMDYLKRCNFMLQQGNYVADAAYFIGEDAPKMTGICEPALPQGYSFDYINGEVLRERATVKDGKLTLQGGMQYSILVLPQLETIRPELLQKISELVQQGLVILGPAPKRSPSLQNYPEADKKVQELAAALWGNVDGVNIKSRTVGKGMVLSGMEMKQAFDWIGVAPDCKLPDDSPALFIHRKLFGGDIYFISNQSEEAISISPEFRLEGKQPELWDAVTGSTRILPEFSAENGKTVVPIQLEPLQSAFIVFREKASKTTGGTEKSNFPEPQVLANFTTPWVVTFDVAQRGPAQPVTMEPLQDWTTFANDSIKYFSGTALYKNEFELPEIPEGQAVYLRLGKLSAMAKVKVNGRETGGVWTAPWQSDITGVLQKGKNTVEISVVNTWVNRLIGDSMLPEKERGTWCPVNPYKPDSPLQPSGLFGPVTVQAVQY